MKKAKADIDVSRRLLARLRDVMAGGGVTQERLDKVVQLIADSLGGDVCSIYVMRAGEVLELFATQGLRQAAVHMTRMRVAEGLVGTVAAHGRAMVLADAWKHPSFSYRPETGEERYNSFMGVPIVRGSRVIGVLVVQNRDKRHYSEVEVESVQTVAMVLAELITSAQVISKEEILPADGIGLLPLRLEGAPLNSGVGIGVAVLHNPEVRLVRLVAEDTGLELTRLRDAQLAMHAELDAILSGNGFAEDGAPGGAIGGDFRDVIQTYKMFAEDAGWLHKIGEVLRSGLTAEAAVQKVQDDTRARMMQVSDPYIRERLHDLEDLAHRLLRHLIGDEDNKQSFELPDNAILVCRNLGPTELLDYDRSKLRGLVMEEGSATMHAVIVARALGIPVVARIKDMCSMVENGDPLIVDGRHGQIFVRPSEDVREQFEASLASIQLKVEAYRALRDFPNRTRDGVAVSLMLNAGLQMDMPHLEALNADGIGLYRTELPFMARPSLPDVEAQTALYTRIVDQAAGKPVIFRTLDVGSDKVLPYWNGPEEDNPAMGWRSIRISLDRPAILRHQLRALIRAAAGRELRLMFPMIADVSEIRQARIILDLELARESAFGPPPSRVLVGTMLEVPALLWQLPALLPHVDFISVGTNDLMQFLFAIDRMNVRLADRYDPLNPAVLSIIADLVAACDKAGVSLSVCGEMASRPVDALALLALGVRTLSIGASAYGPVKAMLLSLNVTEAAGYVRGLCHSPAHSVREKIRGFALDHGVALG